MSLTIRFLFSLFFLLGSSFVFAQNVGDVNNDGKSDNKDLGVIWTLLNQNNDNLRVYQPEIKSFTASPNRVNFGQSSTLEWRVNGNPSSISIDQGVGDVTNLRSTVVNPEVTTTYTLTATNVEGSATEEVTVHVKPRLLSFTSSPRTVNPGEASTLQWRVAGEPTRVSIDQGIGDVTDSNSVTVNPTRTTVYTITAVSSGGSVSSRVTVFVKPKIVSFTANPTTVAPNAASTLSWRIDGGPTEISINQGVGDVTRLTEVEVFPAATTTYTITASNKHGSVSKTVRVEVEGVPVITSFTANTTVLTSGELTTLRWAVIGSTSLSLETSTGSTSSTETVTGSSKRVRPTATTTYTLTATNSTGSTTSTVTVHVLNIISFTANPPSIVSGNSSELSWEIEGGPTEVSINRDVGDVTGSNSVSVSPEQTTTYTLTARKTEGNRSRALTRRVTVTVGNIPVITSFTASDIIVTSGESSVLRWTVTGSTSLSLETSTGSSSSTETVTGSSKRVRPTATTTYTLTATNSTGSATATLQVDFLNITSFTATPPSIAIGSSSELSWEIEGEPTEVSINRDVGDVTGSNSVSVSPEQTTTYTLTARKTDGSISKTITENVEVTVAATPVIESFTASKTLLVAVSNESTLLRWNVTGDGSISVSLSKTEGSSTTTLLSSLPLNSSSSQQPTATTTYTLTATNSTGSVTSTVTVHVLDVKRFSASPGSIIPGANSELSWEIDGEPTSVSIDNSVGDDLAASGSTIVAPTATTTYTLTAQKMDNAIIKAVTREVTVTVKSLPVITSFTADPPVVSCPDPSSCTTSSTLNWDVTGADTLSINQGVGPVTGLTGNTAVTPQDTTVYTLTAANSSGSITKNVTVSVLKINSFTVSPTFISGSEHSVLSWSLSGGPNSISISNNIDDTVLDVTGSTSTVMTPEETTTYTLTVSRTEGATMETVTETATVYKLKIKSFTATPEEITSGSSSSLDWEVDGEPTDVSINHGVGNDLGAFSSASVSPTTTTTYTLTATKTEGSRTRRVSQSVRVTVTASGFSGDDKIQDCRGCPKLSVVPTTLLGQGSFSNSGNIDMDNSFSAIGIQKVTWEEWQMCVSEEVCAYYEFPETLLEHPALGIQLGDVSAYVDWLSFKTGKKYRLLEGQEWQSMIDHIAGGNAPEDINLDSFVTDESDLFLNSSAEISTGFRVVRDIESAYGE